MIRQLQQLGIFTRECSIDRETRADHVYPAHPNGTQLSRDTFLLLFATRGFRGTDDDRSVVGQLRRGGYDGPLVREILFARSLDDWQPFEDGRNFVKQCGHPTIFGVPRGVTIKGKPAPSANCFVVKWRQSCRYVDPDTGLMTHMHRTDEQFGPATQAVEMMQFRLNEAEDNIEVIQPAQLIRQRGFRAGYSFCQRDVRTMNQSLVQAVPFNDDATEWVEIGHVTGGSGADSNVDPGIMPIRHRYCPDKGFYEWIEAGPVTRGGLIESMIAPWKGAWVICARRVASNRLAEGGPLAWAHIDDPFAAPLDMTLSPSLHTRAPITMYRCADGVLRAITSDARASNGGDRRDPLHLFDVDPDHGFAASNRRVIFDSIADRAPIRRESIPSIDMGKILPHAGGATQLLVHRVRPTSTNDSARTGVKVNEQEKAASAIYCAELQYDQAYPSAWSFDAD